MNDTLCVNLILLFFLSCLLNHFLIRYIYGCNHISGEGITQKGAINPFVKNFKRGI